MDEAVGAAEVNRRFSVILREVWAGRSFIVTSHGTPVARIVPAPGERATAAGAARNALLDRLRGQSAAILGERWRRGDL